MNPGVVGNGGRVVAKPEPLHGFAHSAALALPANAIRMGIATIVTTPALAAIHAEEPRACGCPRVPRRRRQALKSAGRAASEAFG